MDSWLRRKKLNESSHIHQHKQHDLSDQQMVSCWTRNFYDLDAVSDALFASLTTKSPLRRQHAIFWAHELWVSEEWDVLHKTLTRAFLTYPPDSSLLQTWTEYNEKKRNEDSVTAMLTELLSKPVSILETVKVPYPFSPKDSNQGAVQTEGTSVPSVPANWTAAQRACFQKTVRSAEQKGQGLRLFHVLSSIPAKEAVQYLSPKTIKSAHKELVRLWKQGGKGLQHVLVSAGIPWYSLEEWPADEVVWPQRKIGTLAARTFRTGKRKWPMEPSAVGTLTGCAAWQRILSEFRVNREASQEARELVFETQDLADQFYSLYFPDDLPDEWTAEEKAKSHLVSA